MSIGSHQRVAGAPRESGSVDLEELASALVAAMPELEESEQRVAVELYRLLAEGLPVSRERLAERAGLPPARIAELLERWPGVYPDDEGLIVGFWGLAQPTMPPHRFGVGARQLSTWCAWDALFIPVILGKTARVESTCATTGDLVRLSVGPGGIEETSPPGVVLSFLRREEKFDHDIILDFCHHVLFFASPEAGREWTSRREGAFLLSVAEGFELGRLVVERQFGAALRAAR